MTNPAVVFAREFDACFRSLTRLSPHGEIALFRAMRCALVGLNNQFKIEEYHGNSHQVIFTGNGNYARTNACCELSDLMIITYSKNPPRARLTYLQAKFERTTVPNLCMRQFSANLEQWFLLSRRPIINGKGAFDPPADLLKAALLPSIGSFAFFYKDNTGDIQIYYTTANYLRHQQQNPPRRSSPKYGKLQARGPCRVNCNAGYKECRASCGNQSFAESLYRLEIGTPVDKSITQAQQTRNWLAAHLRAIQEARRSDLAEELREILVPDTEELEVAPGFFGAKSLIIIKSNFEVRHG